ncbi:MAG: hypothetical protein PUD44_02505 [Clostridiaceae bacterium]|nr:hypothetical protein [Clostridiales bacterium]MDD6876640.1 hypothetical protein [Clostridiaceae bacterium]MDY3286951.1 hypothetical protein [Eubacteriales bacterium]MDY5016284.1 hypothetical protein [Eubacteriales bacterium]
MRSLKTGYAYHGNRMPQHVETDLRDMAAHDTNLVVHMLSHTDWDRHLNVMKEIVAMTEGYGMEAWIDNWGIGGPPGDKDHFLAYHPEAHMIYSDGSLAPVHACLNHPAFRQFTKEWVDAVAYIGGKKIFWDEPHLPKQHPDGGDIYTCTCPVCRKIFKERYGYDMPLHPNADVEAFRTDTIVDYFSEVTEYAAKKGIENAVCVMLGDHGVNLDSIDRLCSLPSLQDVGSDPYWLGSGVDPYEFVYKGARRNIEVSEKFGKEHNIWIQTYKNPVGSEEEIIAATEAAYDAGARTIIAWGYYGSTSNDYRAKNPEVVRAKTAEAFRRIWDRERDRVIQESRARLGITV